MERTAHRVARIEDTLRLRNLQPKRISIARQAAVEFEIECQTSSLVRIIGEKYLYVFDLSDEQTHEGVLVDGKDDI